MGSLVNPAAQTPPPAPNAVQRCLHGANYTRRSVPPPPSRRTSMEEEKAPWLRQESVIRSFVPHSLTVCPFAAKNTPSGPERRLAPFAWRKLHPAFGGTHGDSVGDGREELCESTLAATARPAKMTGFGARRAPQGAPPPAGIRHSFIRVPFVDGLPVRCKEHPLRCKRSGSTSPIEKDIDGGGERRGSPFVHSCSIR